MIVGIGHGQKLKFQTCVTSLLHNTKIFLDTRNIILCVHNFYFWIKTGWRFYLQQPCVTCLTCLLVLSERMFKVDEVDAKVEMSLFKDHTYSEAFTGSPTIKLGEQAYVQIQVTEPEDFFDLKVNECWATQSAQPNDKSGFAHTLLVNGYVSILPFLKFYPSFH